MKYGFTKPSNIVGNPNPMELMQMQRQGVLNGHKDSNRKSLGTRWRIGGVSIFVLVCIIIFLLLQRRVDVSDISEDVDPIPLTNLTDSAELP